MKKNESLRSSYPWGSMEWRQRSQTIASRIPAGMKIIDLGGGYGNILKFIPDPASYISIDLKPWTDKTVVADFNKGEFPDLPEADFIIAQGVIEYMNDPISFLQSIRKYGDHLSISHRIGRSTPTIPRNEYQHKDIEDFLKKSGWKVEASRTMGGTKIYFCVKL